MLSRAAKHCRAAALSYSPGQLSHAGPQHRPGLQYHSEQQHRPGLQNNIRHRHHTRQQDCTRQWQFITDMRKDSHGSGQLLLQQVWACAAAHCNDDVDDGLLACQSGLGFHIAEKSRLCYVRTAVDALDAFPQVRAGCNIITPPICRIYYPRSKHQAGNISSEMPGQCRRV